ncbi:MAG: carbohydrate-binding protein [Opitutaceae bacterium]|nr:carbohydrate-binding protein [Cytophagales bacterium]
MRQSFFSNMSSISSAVMKIKSALILTAFIWAGISTRSTAQVSTNQFKGVNWADPRDNFQSGVIYISGLSSTDTYASASVVAERVVGQFVSKLGSNSVRLPINEATVSTYWNTYTGAIDMALTKGKVILCYWDRFSGANPLDMNAFYAMWKKVVDKYGSNPNCYFEVYNEPSGFTKANLLSMYATWLSNNPNIPHNRIILDGSGLAMNVPDVGSDPRFSKCLLAVHDYSFFAGYTTEQEWRNHLKSFVGAYANRTVMTEFGAPMKPGSKNGINYGVQDYNSPPGTYFVAYLRGMTSQLREWNMGSFYWPGLRDNDWYSLTTRTGSGASISLTLNNQSGLDRVHYAWGGVDKPRGPYKGTPHAIPGTIQLEEFDEGGNGISYFDNSPGSEVTPVVNFRITEDVDIQTCTDAGGGYNVGYTKAGEWLEYTVNVTTAGNYDVAFRIACNGTGRTLSLSMNGTTLGITLAVPNTGGWQTWGTSTVKNLPLKAGQQVLRLTVGTVDDVNLNYLSFSPSIIAGLENEEVSGIALYPNPFEHSVTLNFKNEFDFKVFDLSGRLMLQGAAFGVVSVGEELKRGVYLLQIVNDGKSYLSKIYKK